jgi:hypothetical protein
MIRPARPRAANGSRSSLRRVRVRAAAVAVVAVLVVGVVAVGRAGASVTEAAATVVDGNGHPLLDGGSASPFGLSLPGQGVGQTATYCANYTPSSPQQLDSYLVPKGTDPSSVTFNPYPSTGGGIFEPTGYYGNVATSSNNGALPSIPNDFAWEDVVSTGTLTLDTLLTSGSTPGVWEAGLACVNPQGQVTTLWNFEVTFAASSSDAGGFTWSVPPPVTTTTTTTSPSAGSGGGGGSGSGGGSGGTAGGATTAPSSNSSSGTAPAASPGDSGTTFSGGSSFGPTADSGSSNASSGTASGTSSNTSSADGGSGTAEPGSTAPVKDPSLLHDALTAAGLSTAHGVAIDLLVLGLLFLLGGLWIRRHSLAARAAAGEGSAGPGSPDVGPDDPPRGDDR